MTASLELMRRAASGELSAVEEIRSILQQPASMPRFDGGKSDGRLRKPSSTEDAAGKSADDLTILVLSNWLKVNGAAAPMSTPPAMLEPELDFVFAPMVEVEVAAEPAQKSRGGVRLRFPWSHRGQKHRSLGS